MATKRKPAKPENPNDVKNFFIDGGNAYLGRYKTDPRQVIRNLVNSLSPVQFTRLKQDVGSWRDSIKEAELPILPFRVKQQRIYIDTIQNGHVFSAIEKRRDLTLLRKWAIVDNKSRAVNEDLTAAYKELHFLDDFIEYAWDSIMNGYSLISLGDVVDDTMADCALIPRWNISPDRLTVGAFPYSAGGESFTKPPYDDWHIWIPTKSENGASPCGYGLLYKIALYEILLRQNLTFNATFVEMFAQPYRTGKTMKTDKTARDEFAQLLIDMGSSGWALLDEGEDIEFKDTTSGGTAWQSYQNFEGRLVAAINKVILGHEDAMQSTPGALGSQQGEDNPVTQALRSKQQKDGNMIERIINLQLNPRLKKLGVIDIPQGYTWAYVNDDETEKAKSTDRTNAKEWADIAVSLKNAGLKIKQQQLEEKTGLSFEAPPEPEQIEKPKPGEQDDDDDLTTVDEVKNKLVELYR